jgi:hypothetical protein
MKSLPAIALLLLVTPTLAEEAKPLLVQPGKVVAQPDLKEPLGAEWSVRKGTWDLKDGEFVVAEVPAEKHSAVLWHQVALQSAVIDCEFLFDGASGFLIGCDSANKHVGRLVITRKSAKISEDSTEVKGVHPGQTLGETKLDLKTGEWYPVHFEWTGDKMAARIDGKEIQGQHPTFSTVKARWWFAVGGAKMRVRNVKVREGKTE